MYNVFLVIRTVFFALLACFHVLVLVFASWNIVAVKSFGASAPGASVFLLVNSVFIFVLVPTAYLAQVICTKARPAHVRVECAWTALMSILQLAASIDVTVNGPPIHCQTHSSWAACVSSSLLVHISWLVTLIISSYCLMICVASATHATFLPTIWTTPIPHVPWFSQGVEAHAPLAISHLPTHMHSKTPSSSSSLSEKSCAVSKYIAEQWEKLSRAGRQPASSGPVLFTPGRQSIDPTRPTWARQYRLRRGVDHPFAKPMPERRQPPVLLVPPPRTYSRQVAISEDSDSVHASERPVRTMTRSYTTLTSQTSSVFPREITNPDLPIPRPSLSKWVRADVLSWISIRTEQRGNPLP